MEIVGEEERQVGLGFRMGNRVLKFGTEIQNARSREKMDGGRNPGLFCPWTLLANQRNGIIHASGYSDPLVLQVDDQENAQ